MPKSSFLKEAYRLLRPSGRLVITDGYLKRPLKTAEERQAVGEFKEAFALKEFITSEAMSKQIKLVGFKNIKDVSKTEAVKPSVDYFYKLSKKAELMIKLLAWTKLPFLSVLKRNARALIKCREGIYGGFMVYWLHVGEK